MGNKFVEEGGANDMLFDVDLNGDEKFEGLDEE